MVIVGVVAGHAGREKSIIDKSAVWTASEVAAGKLVMDVSVGMIEDTKESKDKVGEMALVTGEVAGGVDLKSNGALNPSWEVLGGGPPNTSSGPP